MRPGSRGTDGLTSEAAEIAAIELDDGWNTLVRIGHTPALAVVGFAHRRHAEVDA